MSDLAKMLAYIDFSALFDILAWTGALLGAVWISTMTNDPANRYVTNKQLWLRRFGVFLTAGGLLASVLFGKNQGWTPWPTAPLIALGVNLYYASSIVAAMQRAKVCRACPFRQTTEAHNLATMPIAQARRHAGAS